MRRLKSPVSGAVIFLLAAALRAQSSEELNFLTDLSDFARICNMLPEYLNRIAAALAPWAVWIVDAQDPLGKPVRVPEVRKRYARAFEAFKTLQSESKLHIEARDGGGELGAVLEDSK